MFSHIGERIVQFFLHAPLIGRLPPPPPCLPCLFSPRHCHLLFVMSHEESPSPHHTHTHTHQHTSRCSPPQSCKATRPVCPAKLTHHVKRQNMPGNTGWGTAMWGKVGCVRGRARGWGRARARLGQGGGRCGGKWVGVGVGWGWEGTHNGRGRGQAHRRVHRRRDRERPSM